MCKWRVTQAHNVITIEPVFFFYSLSNGLRWVVFQTLLYQKVCLTSFNTSVCDSLSDPVNLQQETHVQEISSQWEFYDNLAFTLPSILLTLLYGSWSDQISRKWPVLLTNIGAILHSVVLLLLGIYIDSPVPWVLLGSFLNALCGGFVTMITCGLSYLSIITTESNRTLRISIAEAMLLVSGALSHLISGDLLKVTSFTFVYSLCIALNILVIIYTLVWLKDMDKGLQGKQIKDDSEQLPTMTQQPDIFNSRPQRQGRFIGQELQQRIDQPGTSQSHTESNYVSYAGNDKVNSWTATVCDRRYLTDIFRVLIKRRELRRRKHIFTQLSIIAFFILAVSPVWTLSYLFLRHKPLSWDPVMYGHFSGYNAGTRGIYLLILLPVMKRCLGLSDTLLMIMGTASGMASLILFGSSTHTWMVFMVPLVGIFSTGTIISIRGLISTMVDNTELGKIFGIVASLENLSFLLASCLYNYVLYPHTVTVWPGLSFIIGAALMIIPMLLSSWLHVGVKRQSKYRTMVEEISVINETFGDGITPTDDKEMQPATPIT